MYLQKPFLLFFASLAKFLSSCALAFLIPSLNSWAISLYSSQFVCPYLHYLCFSFLCFSLIMMSWLRHVGLLPPLPHFFTAPGNTGSAFRVPFFSRDASREVRSCTAFKAFVTESEMIGWSLKRSGINLRNNTLVRLSTGKDKLWDLCIEEEASSCWWYKVPCGQFLSASWNWYFLILQMREFNVRDITEYRTASTQSDDGNQMERTFREEKMRCWRHRENALHWCQGSALKKKKSFLNE